MACAPLGCLGADEVAIIKGALDMTHKTARHAMVRRRRRRRAGAALPRCAAAGGSWGQAGAGCEDAAL